MARATPDPLRCSAGPILFPVFEPPPDNLEDDIEEDEEVTFNVEDDIPVVFRMLMKFFQSCRRWTQDRTVR